MSTSEQPALPADSRKSALPFFGDGPDAEPQLDLLEYWRSVTKRKWSILLFALTVTLLAGVIVFAMTPIFRATTTVLIESNKNKVVSIEDVYSGVGQSREFFQTQVELIKSREVAIKAIKSARLFDNPEFDPRLKEEGAIQAVLISLGLVDKPDPIEWDDDNLSEAVFEAFSKKLTIEPVRLSQLAKVSFDSASPALAARVANEVTNTYIVNDLEARYAMTRQANDWLDGEMVNLKQQLVAAEERLQRYREKSGIIETKGLAQSGASRNIEDLYARMTTLRVKRAEVESIYDQIKSAKKGDDMSSLPAVLRDPAVANAKVQENMAERKLAELAQRYGPEHPRYVSAQADLKSAKETTRDAVALVVDSVTREYESSLSQERALDKDISRARGAVANLNRKEFDLVELEREVESNRQIYEMFKKRSKETGITVDFQTSIARVVDAATIPNTPIKPKRLMVVAIALVMGLFMGAATAILIDRLDNTIKNTQDVESKLRAPILAILPKLGKAETRRTAAARLFLDKPNSIFSEAIRSARTGVMLSAIDQTHRILLITSSLPGEGKSTTAINLALAHAQTQKTLLIDADMRRPSVARGLELPPAAKGLSNLVSGSSALEECLHPLDGTTLTIIPSGTIPPNPLELLMTTRFRDTLIQLASQFETIIIDSPPVELVSDALVIAPNVTGVVYVVKSHETPYQIIRKGLRRIAHSGGHLLGINLNQFDFERAEKYHGDYTGYGKYGYGKHGYRTGYGAPYGAMPEDTAAKV